MHNENVFQRETCPRNKLLLTEFTIGKGGNWGFGLDSFSKNLTKAVDKDASWYCKIYNVSWCNCNCLNCLITNANKTFNVLILT